jgi:CDP-diacylglycerol--serine O-phosphatidyltransferase
MVLPVIVVAVLFIALLISFPWHVLSAGTLLFLCSLPVGYLSYREHERRAAQAAAPATGTVSDQPAAFAPPAEAARDDRPERLN